MGSQLVPQLQALHMIPVNLPQCHLPSRQLGFSPLLSCGPFIHSRISISRFSTSSNFNPIVAPFAKRNFIVRAESGAEGESEAESTESAQEESEAIAVLEGEAKAEAEEEAKSPRKPRVRLGDIMGILNQRAIEESLKKRPLPEVRTGDILELKLENPALRRRVSTYKGIVISRQNAGIHTTIRIRRFIAGVGVEIVFPLYSPRILQITVVRRRKVRRARLYYLREKLPKFYTFK